MKQGKIILIEGPDSTGKTSLYNAINNLTKAAYIHITKPQDDSEEAYIDMYKNTLTAAQLIKDTGQYVVLDRHLISNIIYDRVFENIVRDNSGFIKAMFKTIDCFVMSLPSDKNVYLNKFEEMKATRAELYKDMSQIYDAYYDLWNGVDNLTDAELDNVCTDHEWYFDVLKNWDSLKIYLVENFQNCKWTHYDMQSTTLDKLEDFVKENII